MKISEYIRTKDGGLCCLCLFCFTKCSLTTFNRTYKRRAQAQVTGSANASRPPSLFSSECSHWTFTTLLSFLACLNYASVKKNSEMRGTSAGDVSQTPASHSHPRRQWRLHWARKRAVREKLWKQSLTPCNHSVLIHFTLHEEVPDSSREERVHETLNPPWAPAWGGK